MSSLNTLVFHMELITKARIHLSRNELFFNLKPWEERLKSHPEFQKTYLFMLKLCL